ncbi:uncharacterized protein LOC104428069 [Eucalyptus grandis]|uniref:uncharacterized protein LOC104428069 n=1 Tax=Eucalyptus grandis TaxID=71139 RepID=UPI00192ECF8F|nr:uncharacterized protein LOC104428069 [Eucalyptus grandis]
MTFSFISDLWNKWNIRGSVILSLSLQVFLILFAPLRKKIANRPIVFLLWLAYLMADSIAIYGIGLISHNQGNLYARAAEINGALQAFWASFLLLHLGGPDTITAFSLEDSSLWGRHLLTLIFQVGAAIYLFMRIFPSDKLLVIPTMLVFLAGVIKNAERTLALNFSSLPRLKESLLQQNILRRDAHLKLVEELKDLRDAHFDEEEAKFAESKVVKHAYLFFQIFKVFVGDLMFHSQERKMSCEYFCKVSAVDALRIISVELQFIYEVLYTKTLAICSKWSYIFRFIAFTDIVMAFILFSRLKKHWLPKLDVEITYSLLFGGMALDVIGLFMLVFSDWTVGRMKCYNIGSSKLDSFFHMLVSAMSDLRKPRLATREVKANANAMYAVLDTPFIFRRWSESISACNLLSEFLKESPRKMYKCDRSCGIALSNICNKKIIFYFHQTSEAIARLYGPRKRLIIANTKYVSSNLFVKKLWIFIFKEVKRKSEGAKTAEDVKQIFETSGRLFLQSTLSEEISSDFLAHVTNTNYDNSILSWHIATEIWYNKEKSTMRKEEREFSKILSDYMLYLLLNQHNVVSAVAGTAQMTSAEMLLELKGHIGDATKDIEQLCKKLYDVPLINFRSTSVLLGGVELAKSMERQGDMKWKVMSGVWVELLSYAAGHIKGEAHVQVLSKGGELLTFVWLLMAHFGCLYKPGWGICYEFSPYAVALFNAISV